MCCAAQIHEVRKEKQLTRHNRGGYIKIKSVDLAKEQSAKTRKSEGFQKNITKRQRKESILSSYASFLSSKVLLLVEQ